MSRGRGWIREVPGIVETEWYVGEEPEGYVVWSTEGNRSWVVARFADKEAALGTVRLRNWFCDLSGVERGALDWFCREQARTAMDPRYAGETTLQERERSAACWRGIGSIFRDGNYEQR